MPTLSKKWIIACVPLLAVIILVIGTWLIARIFFTPALGWPGSMMGSLWNTPFQNRNFTNNGEQIFFSGTSRTGPPITFQMQNSARMAMMMQGGMACANCHGANGMGGTLNMMMTGTVDFPNIQYKTLTEAASDRPPYTDTTLKRAITEGLDPDGKPLDWPMPKWKMTDQQVNDLIAFLKSLH